MKSLGFLHGRVFAQVMVLFLLKIIHIQITSRSDCSENYKGVIGSIMELPVDE